MNAARQGKYDDFVGELAEHPHLTRVLERLDRAIAKRQKTGGAIVLTGPTGIGKSTLIKLLQVRLIKAFKERGAPAGLMPFLGVTAIPPLYDTYRFASLFEQILEEADEPLRDKPTSRPAEYRTSDALERAAINVLRYREPGLFAIDEAQHMTYAVREQRLAAHLDLVKWIASESKRPVLLVGTWELLRFARVSGQLGRRMKHIEFLPYDWASDPDRADFRRIVRFFVQKLPVRIGLDPADDADLRLLFAGCLGSVGLLKEWFEEALHDCYSDGRDRISRDQFIAARAPKGKLLRIARENEQGLLELKLMNDDPDRDIERLLGMNDRPASVTAPPRPKLLPGTRKPVRDPVGPAAAA